MNIGLIIYLVVWLIGIGALGASWGKPRPKRNYGWGDLIGYAISLAWIFWIVGWTFA